MHPDFMAHVELCTAEGFGNPWRDNQYVPMQFTGLLDKLGKEIYEGDIVEVVMRNDFDSQYIARASVVWSEPEAMWCVASLIEKDGSGFVADLGRKDEEGYMEVIGNIYSNPELLDANQKGV